MTLNNAIYSTLFIVAVTIGLSFFAGVAYAYTLCGLAALIAVGHLITLDDDMPGEWSNPEGDKSVWHSSLVVLAIKFLVFVVFVIATLSFPSLAKYGAWS
ncbi:hypothetical protein KUV22_02740 [Microbulbifer agarilyticus]|uniref:hypothetical protein n=1 Tax=Microbulbifer agarilyticus TaxID=260552 RepID=UPI001C97DCD8|nr:hypothetical protein [Microbulbifer agarilyticus]MBY6189325.1 hypothetical protein [Microbulbifer agarilyticus]